MKRATVTVPHGFADNGSWLRRMQLRQLNGYDEQYIGEMEDYPLTFRTTALLSRVLTIGTRLSESDIQKTVRNLTVGDRTALMLHLRRLTFGDEFHCTLSCPSCKEAMSLDLTVSSLLQPPISQPKSEYVISVGKYTLKVVPVGGANLEAILKDSDRVGKPEKLVRSCVVSSDPDLPDKLDDDLLSLISSKLEELDPQADIVLDAVCPSCQQAFQIPFSAEDFIFQEIGMRQNELDKEVHWLAFNYHWSEDSILSLPLSKRRRYVELINTTMSGESI